MNATSASFSYWALAPDAEVDVFVHFRIPEGEELVTVPAGPHESARLTLHRIQRAKSSVVVLLTQHNGEGVAAPFCSTATGSPNEQELTPVIDLGPSTTVEEWLTQIEDLGGRAFVTAHGLEFAAELSKLSQFEDLPA